MNRKLIGLIPVFLLYLSVAEAATPSGDNQPAFEAAKKAVSYNMKDPDSTQFRNLRFGGNNQVFVCGEVNAKNSFGAYAGFTPFYYNSSDGTITVYDPQSKRADFDAIAMKMICK